MLEPFVTKKRGKEFTEHSATDMERVFAGGIVNTGGFGVFVGVNGVIWFNGSLCLVCARTKAALSRHKRVSGSIGRRLESIACFTTKFCSVTIHVVFGLPVLETEMAGSTSRRSEVARYDNGRCIGGLPCTRSLVSSSKLPTYAWAV
jgi:hypothetical protein